MIRQDDRRFTDKRIPEWGCVLLSYLWYANKLTNYGFDIEGIQQIVKDFEARGWIDGQIMVLQPDRILGYFGIALDGYVRAEVSEYICGAREYELLTWHYTDSGGHAWEHTTAGSGNGEVTYDPLGLSHSVANGKIKEKRVFKVAR